MWHTYHAPSSLPAALELLAKYGDNCRVVAGGTDVILEFESGSRARPAVVDISRIPGLDAIEQRDGVLSLGPMVTHSQVVAAPSVRAKAFPLAQACWLVGVPQVRNRATVAGNLITASPAGDTITALAALGAMVTLASHSRGSRTLALNEFFKGVRLTAIAPDELLVRIDVPVMAENESGTFLKLGLRHSRALSVVNVAVVLGFDGVFSSTARIAKARIAMGAVAPTIMRAVEAEDFLIGKTLDEAVIAHVAELAGNAAQPISDTIASADYRRDMVRVLVGQALLRLCEGSEKADWPARPTLLWGKGNGHFAAGGQDVTFSKRGDRPVRTVVNGKPVTLLNAPGKTLLHALRDDAGLTGTKEGCSEGECGACTVYLDGIAVMACLVPAERAEGCEIVTIEGLATDGGLHPVQQAFVDAGAVQCGFCTPGMVMAAASLLDANPAPTAQEVASALDGHLCRCTGYVKIQEAVELASQRTRGGA